MTWRSRRDRDLDDEIRQHLDEAVRDRIERGETPEAAAYAVRREFGNIALVRETTREMWGWTRVERCVQDLRYGARLLSRNPGFSIVAILSLALGIGANTALFQILNAVRLRTLPISRPDELLEVRLTSRDGARGNFSAWYPSLTNPIWEQIRDRQQAFAGVFAWGAEDLNLAAGGPARMARGLWVSGNLFDVLGVRPSLGRLITVSDDRRGCGDTAAAISHAFWQREFGGAAAAVGSTLRVNGHPVEIVGVVEPRFFGLEVGRSFDVALPICADPAVNGGPGRLDVGTEWWLDVMGRVKAGWTPDQATAHLRAISPALFRAVLPADYPRVSVEKYLAFQLEAVPAATGLSQIRETYETPLWLLLGTAGLVLLIACANLANLLLARASAREREIAVRLNLGASRGRIIGQLLTESLLLASVGAACGIALATVLSRALVALLNGNEGSIVLNLGLDWRVLGFTTGLTVITCLMFGLAPAYRATRLDTARIVKGDGRGMAGGRDRTAARRMLVVAQIALSLVLLIGALLFASTLRNLLLVDPGFRDEHLWAAAVDFSRLHIPSDRRQAFKLDFLRKLRSIPGVESVASSYLVPVSGDTWGNDTWLADDPARRRTNSYFNRVSEGYFATLQIPVIAGREFSDQRDGRESPEAAIVNEAFMKAVTGGLSPVGRAIRVEQTPTTPEKSLLIVGLVRNAKYASLREEARPTVFLAASQDPRPSNVVMALVRSRLEGSALVLSIGRAAAAVSPDIGLRISSVAEQIRQSLLRERLMATLSIFFGGLAVILAAVGLYGVISYTVVGRTKEIGVRMALGASRRAVSGLIFREAVVLLAVGIPVGLALAMALSGMAENLLFGLKPDDPSTLMAAAAALTGIAMGASYVPVRRAMNIEPTVALRTD